ncbi:hypothetical protein ARMSODRAFT_959094 [Armillaria solidipes]|uniref:Uncharacterized protein n=1 Tax=Armillaria solidipes TaxID=1076256 RepID=A0A2H3BWT2_9AGAR|nr:hypothetical protein ARMSODRAFT_959094 [Armillaria solidipes]
MASILYACLQLEWDPESPDLGSPRYLRLRDLFNHTVEFAFQHRLCGPPHGCTRRRIPFRIGSVGQLQE